MSDNWIYREREESEEEIMGRVLVQIAQQSPHLDFQERVFKLFNASNYQELETEISGRITNATKHRSRKTFPATSSDTKDAPKSDNNLDFSFEELSLQASDGADFSIEDRDFSDLSGVDKEFSNSSCENKDFSEASYEVNDLEFSNGPDEEEFSAEGEATCSHKA